MIKKKAQVWIETVIYTLIGLILIGTLLAFATPAIEKQKDKSVVEKTIEALNELDNNILEVKSSGVANTRETLFIIKKGSLAINSSSDKIIFKIDESSYAFSEIGKDVKIPGTNQKVLTQKKGKKYIITLTLDYAKKIDITYDGNEEDKIFNEAPTPYVFIVENVGYDPSIPDGLVNIDIYSSS